MLLVLLSIFVKAAKPYLLDSVPPMFSKMNKMNAPYNLNDSTKRLVSDTSKSVADSTKKKVDTINVKYADSEIKDKITYRAADSIVYDLQNKKMYLYDSADMVYDKIKLKANLVDFDWTTYTLSAKGKQGNGDSTIGNPVFTESDKEYRSKKMSYNFKTKRGKVYEVITKEGDAYLHSEAVKRNEYEEWYGYKNKYTTCDLEHPHFYFNAKKVKVIPNKIMVTGPTNLVIADLPTPIYLPFAIFPVKQGRRSGIILPKPGEDNGLGFFLKDGGYFFAVNDNLSLRLTADVWTNGSFGVKAGTQFIQKYKYTGSLSLGYQRTRPTDPDLPNVKASNSYSIDWKMNMDPKASPNNTFSANLNAQSSDYYTATRVTDSRILTTQLSSAINYSRVFPGKPISLTLGMNHSQNLLNKTITITLPNFHLGMSRITPFKSKISTGKPKWFETIGLTYSFDAKNTITTYDSIFLKRQTLDNMRFGLNQNFALDAPITVFKFFTLNPGFTYTERTYFTRIKETWEPYTVYKNGGIDTIIPRTRIDTSSGVYGVRNFAASISFGTKITGIFKFKNKYLKAIRHVFTPSISGNYNPDFGAPKWGYYKTVQSDGKGTLKTYSPYDITPIYGIPPQGKVGAIRFNLANSFEGKIFSKKDSLTHERKIGLLDQFNISGGYNFAADSLRLQPFIFSGATRLLKNISFNFNANLDPYGLDSLGRRINTFYWKTNHQLLRFSSAAFSLNATFAAKKKPPIPSPINNAPRFISDYTTYDPNDYYDFNIPWSINASYAFNVTRGFGSNPDTILTSQTLNVNGDFNLTRMWKFVVRSGYDFKNKTLGYTNVRVVRDLHCWELSFDWTAYPVTQQQFVIELKIKSPVLQDLKLSRRRQPGTF